MFTAVRGWFAFALLLAGIGLFAAGWHYGAAHTEQTHALAQARHDIKAASAKLADNVRVHATDIATARINLQTAVHLSTIRAELPARTEITRHALNTAPDLADRRMPAALVQLRQRQVDESRQLRRELEAEGTGGPFDAQPARPGGRRR